MTARRRDRGQAEGDRGGVLPFVAVCLSLLVVSAALAVDLGRFSIAAREARNVADIAALDAVRILDGSSTADQQVAVEDAVDRSALRNGFDPSDGTLTVVLGVYDRPSRSFRATSALEVPNAVRVQAVKDNENLFVPGSFAATRSATASADSVGIAGIGLATTTAAIDTQRSLILNALLGDILGTSINLTVADWQALADAAVTLADLASLGLNLDPTAVEDLLDTVWSVGDLLDAIAKIPLPPGATSALAKLVGRGPDPFQLRLADFIQVDLTNPGSHLFGLSIVDLLQAAAMASGLGHTITVGLGAAVPGLASATAQVQIVEAPQFAVGGVGTTVRSAQIRTQIDATLLPVPLLGLQPVSVHLPISVDTGRGQATITGIACGGGPVASSVDVAATTATATVRIADHTGPLGGGTYTPATLVTVQTPAVPPLVPAIDVLRIEANTSVSVLSGTGGLAFAPPYGWQPTQRVSSISATGAVADVSDTQLDAYVLGVLPLPVGSILGTVVDTAVNPVLEALLPPLLRALGVDLGVADVSVPLATCQSAALVE